MMDGRIFGTLALAAAIAILASTACSRSGEGPEKKGPRVEPGALPRAPAPEPPLAPPKPALRLKVYPDMAVPGKEVVLEAEVMPGDLSGTRRVTFVAVSDPCEGELVQDGDRAVYHVPPKCRGSGITLECRVTGPFGELSKAITLDIKKSAHMESVVINYPMPGDRVWAPIYVGWDKTLYQNRVETLSFSVKRREHIILETMQFAPDSMVELDIPPSPDPVVLTARASGGSTETALLRVFERRAPEWSSNVLLIDSFALADINSLDEERVVLNDGGKVVLGAGVRVSAAGERNFLYMKYHVSKAARYSKKNARLGVKEMVRMRSATTASYKNLRVWLRGEPARQPAAPVYVEVVGSKGSRRTFKIVRLRETWRHYHFPLNKALRKAGESVREVSIFLDAKDVMPPLGHVMFGGLYLEPHPRKKDDSEDTPQPPPPGVE